VAATTELQGPPPRQRGVRRARRWLLATAIAATLIATAGVLASVQLRRPLPAPTASLATVKAAQAPGGAAFAWPAAARQAAVSVGGLPGSWTFGNQAPVPIASVAKIMTAYIVLRDHPLRTPADTGPAIRVDAADAAIYQADVAAGDSYTAVAAGESLTERQALEALMLPSADNVADLLAEWDSGTIRSFAAKMNAQARAIGMNHTDYTDPSGLAASTVSTAGDQVILVRKAMADPAFAGIVALPSAVIPVAGRIWNVNHTIGQDGILGVKTGSDSAAKGAWAFAVRRVVAGAPAVVYGAVLGVPFTSGSLARSAIASGVSLADSAPRAFRTVTVLPAGAVVASIQVPWSARKVTVVTARALRGLVGPGARVRLHVTANLPGASFRAGQQVGAATASGLIGPAVTSTALKTTGSSGSPSLSWRLLRP
jgi:serine-type D-Ala-D-Ala carboxypeptidase (penicillin-binding protein 5/6)